MTEDHQKCRICLKPLHPFSLGEKNDYKLVACRACGSVMTEPWPTPADLDAFFGEIQPEIVHLPNPEDEMARLKKLIGKIAGKNAPGQRFLDITCRQGYAVMAAKELKFEAQGIDSHDFFVAFAKDKYEAGLFEHTTVVDYAASGQQADVIFSVESFCEQTDPNGYMAALAKILAPGGMIYIHEPDGNSFHLPKKFSNWVFADPPLNFSYLSKKGMAALLNRHGLKVRESLLTWGPFMRLVAVRK